MLIKLDKDFMVNTEIINGLSITASGMCVKLTYGQKESAYWNYNYTEEEGRRLAQEKFDELSEILEKAVNIKLSNGAFVCSHCGAPNSE